jgi:hypothetical protein
LHTRWRSVQHFLAEQWHNRGETSGKVRLGGVKKFLPLFSVPC